MKKGIIVMGLVMMASLTNVVYSQERNLTEEQQEKKAEWENLTPEEKAAKKTEQMTAELDLSEDQASKIEAINLAFIIEMEKIKEERKALKEKAKAQREKTKKEIDEVLTTSQKEKMDAKMEERKKKHHEKKENCQHH